MVFKDMIQTDQCIIETVDSNTDVIFSFISTVILPHYFPVLPFSLKTVDTIGNCQRLAFTVGVSQHVHTITNL